MRGVKTPEGRFAQTIESELNRMGEAGWEYQRAELLPHEERGTLKAAQTKWRTVLVFRRQQETSSEMLPARVIEDPPADPAPIMTPVADPMPVRLPVLADKPELTDPPLTEEPNVVALPPRDEDDPAKT